MNKPIHFIGLGAPKCATTWITDCLYEHPEISMPKTNKYNELNYFSQRNSSKNSSEYSIRGIEPYLSFFKKCDFTNKKVGEMSTNYLADKYSPYFIKKHFPNVKLIVAVRNPIDRAFSEYLMIKDQAVIEDQDFITAFNNSKSNYHLENYKTRGLYYQNLKPYFELFPKENIHIVLFEEIKTNPKKALENIYSFLNVNKDFISPHLYKKSNIKGKTKFNWLRKGTNKIHAIARGVEKIGLGKTIFFLKRALLLDRLIPILSRANIQRVSVNTTPTTLDNASRELLKKEFSEDIIKLEQLIGKDLGEWK